MRLLGEPYRATRAPPKHPQPFQPRLYSFTRLFLFLATPAPSIARMIPSHSAPHCPVFLPLAYLVAVS